MVCDIELWKKSWIRIVDSSSFSSLGEVRPHAGTSPWFVPALVGIRVPEATNSDVYARDYVFYFPSIYNSYIEYLRNNAQIRVQACRRQNSWPTLPMNPSLHPLFQWILLGSKFAISIQLTFPSIMSSLIAFPVAGALEMPQHECPVAKTSPASSVWPTRGSLLAPISNVGR